MHTWLTCVIRSPCALLPTEPTQSCAETDRPVTIGVRPNLYLFTCAPTSRAASRLIATSPASWYRTPATPSACAPMRIRGSGRKPSPCLCGHPTQRNVDAESPSHSSFARNGGHRRTRDSPSRAHGHTSLCLSASRLNSAAGSAAPGEDPTFFRSGLPPSSPPPCPFSSLVVPLTGMGNSVGSSPAVMRGSYCVGAS